VNNWRDSTPIGGWQDYRIINFIKDAGLDFDFGDIKFEMLVNLLRDDMGRSDT
jgi:hypothetical protein